MDRTAPNSNGWNNGDVTVRFTCADGLSGVSNNASYPLGSVPAAGCNTTDALSGVATQASLSTTGGNPDGTGSFTATCSGATEVVQQVFLPSVNR